MHRCLWNLDAIWSTYQPLHLFDPFPLYVILKTEVSRGVFWNTHLKQYEVHFVGCFELKVSCTMFLVHSFHFRYIHLRAFKESCHVFILLSVLSRTALLWLYFHYYIFCLQNIIEPKSWQCPYLDAAHFCTFQIYYHIILWYLDHTF